MTEPLDEFGPFTMSQVKNAFDAFDMDQNKYIGAGELRHVYTSIGEDVTDEEIDEMIMMVDIDGDGQVDFNEFAKMIFRYASQAQELNQVGTSYPKETKGKSKAISAVASQERSDALRETLAELNIDSVHLAKLLHDFLSQIDPKEKKLSTEEIPYDKFCALLGIRQSNLAHKLFLLFDADNSGSLDMREFMVNISNYATNTSKADKMLFAFKLFDVDGNGNLTRDELLKILKTNYLATDTEQVASKADMIMRQADTDGDGTVSWEEFQKVCTRFPNLLFPKF